MNIARWAAGLMVAACLAHAQAQTAPTFTREQRISRFNQFLGERKQALYDQGARAQAWGTPAGSYPSTRLLDPRDVINPLAYAINRYDSYQARLQAQATSEDLAIRPVAFGAARPAGHVAPEDSNANVGTPGTDASDALQQAVNSGAPVWLTPGRTYVLRKVLRIPSGARIVSDGSAVIWIQTGDGTAFPADPRNDFDATRPNDNQPIQITSASDVVLRDFRVRLAAEAADVQPLLRGGIQINNSSNVRIEGLELLGFPRTLGILRVNSGAGVTLQDNLIHGGYTRVPTRQVTGIEVDNDRVNEVYSSNLRIVGNFVLGVMLDNGVVFGTGYPDRGAAMLGYETDGINVQTNPAQNPDPSRRTNPSPVLVANNSVMDVGEGIDTFDSNGTYRNNHVERAFGYGIKVIHGASGNLFAGNRVVASGLSSVVVATAGGEPAADGNRFVHNRIRYTNAFRVETLPSGYPRPSRIGAFDLSGYSTRNEFQANDASEPMFQDTSYVSGVYCSWPSASAYANTNLLWKNGLSGFATGFNVPNSECVRARVSAPVLQSISYQEWTGDGVQVETNVRYDFLGEQATTDRIRANVAGSHDVRTGVSSASWSGRELTMSTLVRRGSNARIMMRDQITDWYTIFDLTGEGSIVSRSGSMVTGGGIVRLTDDWYWITTRFLATAGGNFLLTLRQLDAGSGVYLDLGETRLDLEE